MANYLVTGRAGSGKSSVAAELRARGFETYDTDEIVGLAGWVDVTTKEKVRLTDSTNVDLDRYEWLWDEDILRHFISGKDGVILCGSADNDFVFEDCFAKHFVLNVLPHVQIERLLKRTMNDYGKDPAMHAAILAKQAEHIATARVRGAVIIDASQPVILIADQIVSEIA